MMWKLTKSLFNFSWAMSVFGIQQMVNLFAPARAAKAFDDVSRAAMGHVNDVSKASIDGGSILQRNPADLTPDFPGQKQDAKNIKDAAVSQERTPAASNLIQPPTEPSPAPGSGADAPATGGGWGPMPVQSSVAVAPPATKTSAEPIAATDISPEYPYESRYLDVFGSRMHYIEQGTGDPILLLHGNPTWSYIWRNIIPHLSSIGRCIAPDLIGYGRSDKPDIQYRWFDHVQYLDKYIEKMGLKNITLVLHDHGSGLGFHYAMRHPHNIKAIAFFEAIVRPYPWNQFSSPPFRDLFRQFRSGGVGGQGWQMLVEQNMFIEQLLPQAAGRPLTEKEMSFYREPFPSRESRVPIWRLAGETPIGGEPRDVWNAVASYSERLQQSNLPKLMLYFAPGALLTAEHVNWCKQNIRNLHMAYIGPGLHFVQESSPHQIGQEIASWCRNLPFASTA